MRKQLKTALEKQAEREQEERLRAEFFARGGQIERYPLGARGPHYIHFWGRKRFNKPDGGD